MAAVLTPSQAAEAASSAYFMRDSRDLMDAWVASPQLREVFDIRGGTRLSGVTGGVMIHPLSGFGYMAWGTGSRKDECLIAVRGTVVSDVFDLITDVRCGGIRGPSGHQVDVGFWMSAKSLLPQIREQLRGAQPRALHIVGHSLGGGVATLLADAIACDNASRSPLLYTFGSPRCGTEAHARYLTKRLGASNIRRVYHDNDPVAMVPIYPYLPVPYASNGYRLKGHGLLLSFAGHFMDGYAKSVEGCAWSSLPVIRAELGSLESAAAWLKQAAKGSDWRVVQGSAKLLALILSALDWILKALGQAAGLLVFAGATVMDGLARLLYSGVLQSVRIGTYVRDLLATAMRFMGLKLPPAANLTVAVVEYVLDRLYQYVASIARRALNAGVA